MLQYGDQDAPYLLGAPERRRELNVGNRGAFYYYFVMRQIQQASSLVVSLGSVSLLLSACTSNADVFPLNAAAVATGDPRISFVREGIDQGPVEAIMPDGEVLRGYYRVARSGDLAMAFSSGQTATAIGMGEGGVQFVLRGPHTEMLCRGSVSLGGHGNGECQNIQGAVWAVSY